MMKRSSDILVIIICVVVTTIFSLHYLAASEILAQNVSPPSLSAWRGVLGGSLILLLTRQKLSWPNIVQNIVPLFLISFFGFFLNQILFMHGLRMSTPLNAALISNTIPVFSILFAIFIKLEHFGWRKFTGIILSFLFASYLVFSKNGTSHSGGMFHLGNLLILLNVISFSGAFIWAKRMMKNDFPFEVLTGIMLLLGGIMTSLYAWNQLFDLAFYSVKGWNNFLLFLFEVIFSTAIAYFLNLWTLKKFDASKVTFFIYLQPIITSIGYFILTGRPPPTFHLFVFGGICFGGYLILVPRIPRRRGK